MKKGILALLIVIAVIIAVVYATRMWTSVKPINIISHQGETVVTNPATGTNSYKKTVTFPDSTQSVRSIILHVKFQCPDSMRCADWDYSDRITARPTTDTTDFEIARMLTPYGGFFKSDWGFEWQVEVTDFRKLLQNEVEINYIHSGYEPNTVGWKITLDFEVVFGPPVAPILALHKIYDGHFKYGDKTDPIEDHLTPIAVDLNPLTQYTKIKILQTGHGMDANGCGEFCNKYREVFINEKQVNHKALWTECGDNPLYPQAGTWIFDRANWCPGYLLQPDEVLLPITNTSPFVVDINMEPYETENPTAIEHITTYVVEYGKPNVQNDVTLTSIIQLSTEQRYSRKNPTSGFPLIQIKNNGSDPLKQLTINYGIEGEPEHQYQWEGHIEFGAEALISLPNEIITKKDTANFNVTLSKPNGKSDAFVGDNKKTAVYESPENLPQTFVVYYKSNNKPNENAYTIKNSENEIVFKRDSLTQMPSTIYKDTITLQQGHYVFNFTDTKGDGLEFWYNGKAGRGEVKILDLKGQAIKQFGSDFGSFINYNFIVDKDKQYRIDSTAMAAVFPSRTQGPIAVDVFSNTPTNLEICIVNQENELQVFKTFSYLNFKEGTLNLDLSDLPKNRYYIKIYSNDKQIYKNRIRLKE